ncbi:unnamed protein product [Thlaspi arvense]|uniref:PB1 domain-containing protein n=1 Tax=Thlaspi arvense TaxID=13288 RepID=A0AAU9SS65_THLAR|nr:unnamed protein product [Thlaspi arvense]
MSHPTPTQEIVARDLHGREWRFKHILISSHTIYHGVIASTMNAIDTKSMFTVFYKPRIYLLKIYLFSLQQILWKITEIEDFSSYWRNSEWRNLKVQWDEAASIQRPNRISSWDIELLAPSSNVLESSLLKNKRQCQLVEISQEIGQSSMNALTNAPQFSYHDSVDDSKISSGWLMNYIVPTKETTAATTGYKLFGVDLEAPTNSKDIVQMQGIAIGRTVDLTVLGGYNELIDELEKLFDLKDKLRIPNQWKIIFTDDEGDMILVGNDPWPYISSHLSFSYSLSSLSLSS